MLLAKNLEIASLQKEREREGKGREREGEGPEGKGRREEGDRWTEREERDGENSLVVLYNGG